MRLKRHRFNPWVGKIPWSKNTGTSLQYSCLENSMGRGAWEATVYGTEKSQTQRNPSFCENFFQLNIIGAWWPPGNPFLKDSRGQTSSKEYRYPICMKVKVTQSRLTLCDPVDYTVHGILQARILEWVAFPFSRESSQPRNQTLISRIAGRFFTSWATREAQEYWSG